MVKPSASFEAFASLSRFFVLAQDMEPTLRQAEEEILLLCHVYGIENEEELQKNENAEMIETFNKVKAEIMRCVE
ncbi:hypothetical protein [Paenibacillus sp. SI8]|uniref:hypothetical protein n=1 Tax=unclassified Paenibacillus TaxID=185978 RepID=UPI003465F688